MVLGNVNYSIWKSGLVYQIENETVDALGNVLYFFQRHIPSIRLSRLSVEEHGQKTKGRRCTIIWPLSSEWESALEGVTARRP